MLGHLDFNLFDELKKLRIYEAYMDKVISHGISFEQFYHSTKALIESSKNLDFDCVIESALFLRKGKYKVLILSEIMVLRAALVRHVK